MIRRRKEERGSRPRVQVQPSSQVGSGTAARTATFLVVSKPRRFYKMIFEIIYDMY